MSLSDKKADLVETLAMIDDPQERFAFIIDNARTLPPLENDYKIDAFRIEGCQSQLWLMPSFEDGKCHFRSDSDALITRGIAGMLAQLYSDATPEEILANPPTFLSEVGINDHLTPNRRNGLANVWKKIEAYARLHATAASA